MLVPAWQAHNKQSEFGLVEATIISPIIAGLIYLGIFFQETKEGNNWIDKGLND
jgi:hypothetical protein